MSEQVAAAIEDTLTEAVTGFVKASREGTDVMYWVGTIHAAQQIGRRLSVHAQRLRCHVEVEAARLIDGDDSEALNAALGAYARSLPPASPELIARGMAAFERARAAVDERTDTA